VALEERFFETMEREPRAVTIFLLNGVKLQGHILEADERTILLKRENMTQLVFKHAVSTIMPLDPLPEI